MTGHLSSEASANAHDPGAGGELNLALKALNGEMTPEVVQWIRNGLGAWFDLDASDVPLERCLRLPRTPAKRRQARRDMWLLAAAAMLEEDTPWQLALDLERELHAFATRGAWYHWREARDPPAGTSALRTALFYVMKLNGGQPVGYRTIYRLLASR